MQVESANKLAPEEEEKMLDLSWVTEPLPVKTMKYMTKLKELRE